MKHFAMIVTLKERYNPVTKGTARIPVYKGLEINAKNMESALKKMDKALSKEFVVQVKQKYETTDDRCTQCLLRRGITIDQIIKIDRK